MHQLITDSAALARFCESVRHDPFIAIDTEFMREKTYYPELCLVQVAGLKEAAAVDPMAPGLDPSPLYALLADPGIVKVFHACRQDMEIFYHKMQAVPAPIFDTQIAAMVCGYGESVSYETIVNKVLGKAVDKSSRFTDWARRPLSDKQLDYAMHDVIYLRDVYLKLKAQLEASGRASWTDEEMKELMLPETYDSNPDEAWRKFRLRHTSPRSLALLQAAARWREQTARERNVPRGRIMKDETLAEVANAKPADFAGLQAIRGFYPALPAGQYETLLAALRAAEAMPSAACPKLPARPAVQPGAEALADLLRLFLKSCAGEHQVVPRLIADKEELDQMAGGVRDNLHALAGWRKEIFGRAALDLLDGKIALRADGKNGLAFIRLDVNAQA